MIARLIEIEQARIAAAGYMSVVMPVTLTVGRSLQIVHIGNDTYILTGIRASDNDMMNDRNEVCISSPTGTMQGTQRQMATLGQAMWQTFRDYIIIKTTDENGWQGEQDTPMFRLDFIRISPVKRRKA